MTTKPNSEKYTMNVGLLNSSSRSSRDRVDSGTMPNTAMRTAPPAMSRVPSIIQGEKTSPRRIRAKKAFQRRETAPSGASMTTGRDAICTREPRMLEEMNMPKPRSHNLCRRGNVRGHVVEKEGGQPKALTVSGARHAARRLADVG